MQTLQLSNHNFNLESSMAKLIGGVVFVIVFFLIGLSTGWQQTLLTLAVMLGILGFSYLVIAKSRVAYTLTSTHFQQHLYKGGWVVKWSNIEKIGVCTHHVDGWHQPLPWIGIKLKHYSPYLNSICPRVASDILLTQRALLYLGVRQSLRAQRSLNDQRSLGEKISNKAHQHGQSQTNSRIEAKRKLIEFEDIVLDSSPYKNSQGEVYSGLLGMLANRMKYQRNYYDYDIFIAVADLDRDADEFVGLARRYLAAAGAEEDPTVFNNQLETE